MVGNGSLAALARATMALGMLSGLLEGFPFAPTTRVSVPRAPRLKGMKEGMRLKFMLGILPAQGNGVMPEKDPKR